MEPIYIEFIYRHGKRCGSAKYIWADGSIEVSLYDENGFQNGPAKLTWPNGAIREGKKVNVIFRRYFSILTIE